MSCEINAGRVEPCKDNIGGIRALYFINYGEPTIVYDNVGTNPDVITDLGEITAYKYEVKGAGNSFEETINSSRDNGTTFFSQAVNAQLKKMDADTTEQVKLLSWGRPHIVVEDLNGISRLAGAVEGCDLTGGTITTGTARGDLNGYTLTFTGEEKLPAGFLQGAVENDPFAGMSSSVTVVTGTNS